MLDPFAGSGTAAIQLLANGVQASGLMTLVGIALVIAAVAKLIKEASEAIVRLRSPG